MMKGRKDEGKAMSPMFPRLHVNDTEKGGPKAPPRNKMALYEQLSIPSQRFNAGSLPPNNTSSLVPSISSSHGEGNETSMVTPFEYAHESSISPEKFHSYSIHGTKISTTKGIQDSKFSKALDYRSLDTVPPTPAVPERNKFQPRYFSSFKKVSPRKLVNDDDLRVPMSAPSGIDRNSSCSKRGENQEHFPNSNLSSSMQPQNANEISVVPKSRRYTGNQAEENGRLFRSNQDLMERSDSTRDNTLADASSDLSTKIKVSKSLKRPHDSCNKENKSSSVDVLNSEVRAHARLRHEYISVESIRSLENASKVRNESCLRRSLGVDNGSPNALENRSKAVEEKNTGAMQIGGVKIHNKIPSTSVESLSNSDICPDDIVGVIGQKHFWKVRRAIVNQQRIFAVQIFELHRLIKVQRLIAGSPNILLEDTYYMGKPSLNVSSTKKFPSDKVPESALIAKVRNNSQKPNISIECADENAVAKLPLPSAADDTSKGLVTQRPNALATPMAANTRSSSWGFSPPGSQWLVPIMSPSEGFVYKPYAGPCPPTAGFLAPVYGGCGPLNLTAGGADFLNTPYAVPASHQHSIGILPGKPPRCQTYFPHYGMPVRNPTVSGSTVEQISSLRSKGNQLSTGDVNIPKAQQSSCNMSSQMNQVVPLKKLPASKDSEIQGSTSSPPVRSKGDALLPLFPTKPTTQACTDSAQTSGEQTRVIKVIPHNRRLATESAARIFRSIQEERKQYD
ncbi:EARLY FLOWERING 3 [Hibiscus trionum]|uniref:EARLY FLOWERING 3 n=1 Tax=Hibiscus trionum TaxID=183268 RepID=A0A9W7M8X9_HIBTR|nr:EARLY FLOWERING 3 [Hibiscus trionum]